ncbi:MAG: glycine/betaine ABC transporter ATP-binding protein [Marivirga sp.]|nr:glycine/betaine ABC transporter ATP-binding protein [Marivirga sp.]
MKVAELNHVSHSYNGHLAIKDVSFSIEERKITAIIGRSGSGKTSLLQLINGLIRPTSGTVNVLGEPLNYDRINSIRLNMGYMVQGNGLFPHLSILDNISIGKKIFKSSVNPTRRVDELMNFVGLPEIYKYKYPYELSGGEQQRVGICRALFLNPPFLLMDEPLGALDAVTRQEIQDEILKLQRLEPRTILLVTHDMREARKLADYILVLEKGEIQQFDTRQEVLSKPANAVVEKLIEASLL